MRPILFHAFGKKIWSYPAMLYVGLVAGVVAGNIVAHETDINRFRVFVATLILIPAALIGARLLFVFTHWEFYKDNFSRIWDRNEGGWSLYGGLPVAVALSIPLLHILRLGFGAFWDIATFTLLVGMLFTRVGCLLNGCCSGHVSDSRVSLNLPNHLGVWQKRIPSQLLEIAWAFVVLTFTAKLRHSMPLPGGLFLFALAAYATGRFVLEFWREREPGEAAFNSSHVISLLVVIVSVIALKVH